MKKDGSKDAPPDASPHVISLRPEFGFVSRTQYTNGFFGFSLPLPAELDLEVNSSHIPEPFDRSEHCLFGADSTSTGVVTFIISAKKLPATGIFRLPKLRDDLPDLVRSSFTNDVVQIGGLNFTRVSWEDEGEYDHRIYSSAYMVPLNGFLITIFVSAYYKDVLEECEQSIQGLVFFDPELALQQAGPESQPYYGMQRSVTN
jgi:hypothetical protein